MRALIAAAALIALTSTASAQSSNPNNGNFRTSVGTFLLNVIPPRAPSSGGIVHIDREDTVASQERIAAWEKYCQPVLSAPNANGVRYWLYAKPGCQNGRSAD